MSKHHGHSESETDRATNPRADPSKPPVDAKTIRETDAAKVPPVVKTTEFPANPTPDGNPDESPVVRDVEPVKNPAQQRPIPPTAKPGHEKPVVPTGDGKTEQPDGTRKYEHELTPPPVAPVGPTL